MDEQELRQIIREEIQQALKTRLDRIDVHLLAITQAFNILPWKQRYICSIDESLSPPQVVLAMPVKKKP